MAHMTHDAVVGRSVLDIDNTPHDGFLSFPSRRCKHTSFG